MMADGSPVPAASPRRIAPAGRGGVGSRSTGGAGPALLAAALLLAFGGASCARNSEAAPPAAPKAAGAIGAEPAQAPGVAPEPVALEEREPRALRGHDHPAGPTHQLRRAPAQASEVVGR